MLGSTYDQGLKQDNVRVTSHLGAGNDSINAYMVCLDIAQGIYNSTCGIHHQRMRPWRRSVTFRGRPRHRSRERVRTPKHPYDCESRETGEGTTEHCDCVRPPQPWRQFGVTPSQRQRLIEAIRQRHLSSQCSRGSVTRIQLVLKVSPMSCRPFGWDADTLTTSVPDHHSRKLS